MSLSGNWKTAWAATVLRLAGLFWLGLMGTGLLFGQNALIDVGASVDRNRITVGDRITYTLTVRHQPGIEVHAPGQMPGIGELSVVAFKTLPPRQDDQGIHLGFQYTVTAFDTGTFAIPAFPIAWRDSAGAPYQFADSPTLTVTVESVLNAEDQDLRDIRPPYGLSPDWQRWLLWGGILLLLLALAYYLWRRWRGREVPRIIRRKEVIRPAHEVALEAIEALMGEALPERGEFKTFFTRLSEIMRHYLEQRYYIKAMEETSSEILLSLADSGLNDDLRSLIKGIFHNCDLVKFARVIPGLEESRATVAYCREFIGKTRLEFERVEREIVETEPSGEGEA